jgi:predicted Fe-Mo cluster-binding NifX family protein
MTIAIPVADGRLCAHFGHCERFVLVDVDETRKEIVGMTYLDPPPHEPGVLPKWLHERGVNVVIAGGMGRRAQEFFRILGIQVVVGASADTPENVVSAFLTGTLQVGENVCDH